MTQRPYFLNLLRIGFPIGAVVSILHRASGAMLALAVPLLLYALALSLQSAADFARVQAVLSGVWSCLLVWAGLHHLLAGLRHLGFDFGYGERLVVARRTAWAVLVLAAAGGLWGWR